RPAAVRAGVAAAPSALRAEVVASFRALGPVPLPAACAVEAVPESGLMRRVMVSHGATPFL
ncbi:hypothetical protein CIK81_16445, partial [Brachybacterium sp. JB7]